VHIGATWQIRLNHQRVVAIWPYISHIQVDLFNCVVSRWRCIHGLWQTVCNSGKSNCTVTNLLTATLWL